MRKGEGKVLREVKIHTIALKIRKRDGIPTYKNKSELKNGLRRNREINNGGKVRKSERILSH